MLRIGLCLIALSSAALADPARVNHVNVSKDGGLYTFDVTVSHGDTGWDHYVDAWRIVGPDGSVLGTRELAHPHVDEQPFTRSLSGVSLPQGTTSVSIQTRDSVTGWSEPSRQVPIR